MHYMLEGRNVLAGRHHIIIGLVTELRPVHGRIFHSGGRGRFEKRAPGTCTLVGRRAN